MEKHFLLRKQKKPRKEHSINTNKNNNLQTCNFYDKTHSKTLTSNGTLQQQLKDVIPSKTISDKPSIKNENHSCHFTHSNVNKNSHETTQKNIALENTNRNKNSLREDQQGPQSRGKRAIRRHSQRVKSNKNRYDIDTFGEAKHYVLSSSTREYLFPTMTDKPQAEGIPIPKLNYANDLRSELQTQSLSSTERASDSIKYSATHKSSLMNLREKLMATQMNDIAKRNETHKSSLSSLREKLMANQMQANLTANHSFSQSCFLQNSTNSQTLLSK